MGDQGNTERRSATAVLGEWREAERRLGGVPEGSAEWHRTRLRIEELSAEYQALVAEHEPAFGESRSKRTGRAGSS